MELPIEKLWNFVAEGDCWVWPKVNKKLGYGYITKGHSERFYAHRVFYHYLKGELYPDKQLDHLCRNRACVNPDHLELVTAAENKRRGNSPAAINARKTVCSKGHSYTLKSNGKRYCKPCFNEWQRENWRRYRDG